MHHIWRNRVGGAIPVLALAVACATRIAAAGDPDRSSQGKGEPPHCARSPDHALVTPLERGYLTLRYRTPAPQPTGNAARDPTPRVIPATDSVSALHGSSPTLPQSCSLTLYQSFPIAGAKQDEGTFSLAFTKDGLVVSFVKLIRRDVKPQVIYPGEDLNFDDNVAIIVRPPGKAYMIFSAATNAAGNCSSVSRIPGNVYVHNQCKATLDDSVPVAGTTGYVYWSGKLVLSYATLAANRVPSPFDVRIQHVRHIDANSAIIFDSGGPDITNAKQDTTVALDTESVVEHEWFVAGASNIGYNQSVPAHRLALLTNLPVDSHNLISAAFSDDSGPLLTKRDATLQNILSKDQYKAFKCTTCGSFQTDHTTPFDALITSSDILGVDFSNLGVDSPPFTFDAAGYPVDSGYKGIFADDTLGLAFLNGTTQNNGVAHDSVVRATRRFNSLSDSLTLGFFDVSANRTMPAPAKAALYPIVDVPLAHSTNTEGSVGYSHTFSATQLHERSEYTSSAVTLSVLGRYGTQYTGMGANRVDLAVAITVQPPYVNLNRQPNTLPNWSFVAGYRSLGAHYLPIDGKFDPLVGVNGYYGQLLYSEPHTNHPGLGAVSLTAHRFSNFAMPQDTLMAEAIAIRLDTHDHFGISSSVSSGNLTASQVARVLYGVAVSPAQGGQQYLPNNTYSASFTYKMAVQSWMYQGSAGYTSGTSQNCNVKLPTTPCYAYTQPSITAGLFSKPTKWIFFDGTIKNQNDTALDLTSPALEQLSKQPTTAAHIVRKAAFGAYISRDKCSTFVLSTENRGGAVDAFSHSAPQPGFINTAAFEMQTHGPGPAVLVAYDRQSTLVGPPTSEFLLRVRLGVPWNNFQRTLAYNCEGR
jgi:hypothetical protein